MDKKLKTIVKSLDEGKAQNLIVIDISEIFPLADYFIICEALNNVHAQALAERAKETLQDDYKHREGDRASRWLLVDGGKYIIHIFLSEERETYQLEHMYRKGKIIDLQELLK